MQVEMHVAEVSELERGEKCQFYRPLMGFPLVFCRRLRPMALMSSEIYEVMSPLLALPWSNLDSIWKWQEDWLHTVRSHQIYSKEYLYLTWNRWRILSTQ